MYAIDDFRDVLFDFADLAVQSPFHVERQQDLGMPVDLTALSADLQATVAHWRRQNIETGSNAALMVDL